MATDPEDSVIAKIDALGAWTENTNLFKGPMRAIGGPIPQTAVFVTAFGGPMPINFAPNSGALQEYEHAVQVLIRGEAGQYGATLTLAEAIFTALHDSPPSGYYRCRSELGRPVHVGKDERGSFLFVVNLRLGILE